LIDNKQAKFENIFLSECQDNLSAVEKCILDLENNPHDNDIIKKLLRHVHTLKGSSGILGSKILPEIVHHFESLIKSIFNKQVFSRDIFNFLLKSIDYIDYIVETSVKKKQNINEQKYKKNLKAIINLKKKIDKKENKSYGFFDNTDPNENEREEDLFRISITLDQIRNKDTWYPENLIDDLLKIGEIIRISGIPYKKINWKKDDPYQCYFTWNIFLQARCTIQKVIDVFLFFKDKNSILIESSSGKYFSFKEEPKTKNNNIKKSLNDNKDKSNLNDNIGIDDEILKISSNKIDTLINIIGELIITNSNLENIQKKVNDMDLDQALYNISKISKQLRDIILSLKMVPISHLLTKFNRMVRDLSYKFKKKINLIIESRKTEIDKSIFSILQDPILHILRNAIDHGIESPEERERQGKTKDGNIKITAFEENGQIVIEISDDGRGLNKDLILKKAIKNDILEEGETYTDEEIFNTIFIPGFTTKDHTNIISGRGIGMDVVLDNINNINGSVKIYSNPGNGTKFVIRVPLTLAIIDGFLIKIGRNNFVIPRNFVLECFEVKLDKLNSNEMIYNLRGDYLPVKQLDAFFKNIIYNKSNNQSKNIVVLKLDNDQVGILCDDIVGNIQVVIRPISKIINKSMCLIGSTLLGNGDVAFIFDVRNLLNKINYYDNKLNFKLVGGLNEAKK